jgi:hypothetical protein
LFSREKVKKPFDANRDRYQNIGNHESTNQYKRDTMAMLKCDICGETQEVPMHCGEAMKVEGDKLVCCMGSECGEEDIPIHCDQPMSLVEEE